jgi:hypothetical protein
MTTKTIAQLTAASAAAPTNLFEIDDDSGRSFKLTAAQLLALVTAPNVLKHSGNITLDNTTKAYTYSHGLSYTPVIVRVVFVCIAADSGWGTSIGDEVDATQCQVSDGLGVYLGANASTLTISYLQRLVGLESIFSQSPKSGGASSPTSFNHFALKFYFF